MSYIDDYLKDLQTITTQIDKRQVDAVIDILFDVREREGRLFFIGVGGGASHCTHAVADFRKTAGFEAYTPADNMVELTARTNDKGWDTVFVEWLKGSRLNAQDAVFVFSVGGGDKEANVSPNLIAALEFAKMIKAKILGIVGRNGGFTAQVADACIVVPPVNKLRVTPLTEAYQAVLWHLIVTDPRLKVRDNKWESLQKKEKE